MVRNLSGPVFAVTVWLVGCSPVIADSGTFSRPIIHNVTVLSDDSINIRRTIFSYSDGSDEVMGTKTSLSFSVNAKLEDVWPTFQDFNAWQGHVGYSWTGNLGDREGELEFIIQDRADATVDTTQAFIVQHIIPENLIVLRAPGWEQMGKDGKRVGNRHEGVHAFTLTPIGDNTLVTANMEHSYYFYGSDRKEAVQAAIRKRVNRIESRLAEGKKDLWQTAFMPKLKELVEPQ